MDGNIDIDRLASTKFGIGQLVPRNEDPMLVRGYAHGVINGIDTEEASQPPGVLGVFTGPDLTAAGIKNMPLGQAVPTADRRPMHRPSCPVLTSDKARYVGDPIGVVVAETAVQAKDAAEAVLA